MMAMPIGHRTCGKRFAYVILGVAVIAPAVGGAQEDRFGASVGERPMLKDAAERPVVGEGGARLNYGPAELRSPSASLSTPRAAQASTESSLHTDQGIVLATTVEDEDAATSLPRVLARWNFAALGSSIGLSGIVTARNGLNTEIYVAGSTETFGPNTAWYALRRSATTNTYEPIYVSDHLPAGIRRIAVARTGAGLAPQIVVALANGIVRRYDQPTKRLLSTNRGPCIPYGGLEMLATADLDRNGSDELISSCADRTLVVDYGRGRSPWIVPGGGGQDLVVGQMDNDAALEIATTGGYVFDTGTRAVQWQRPEGFGAHLQAADIDGDRRAELIAADEWFYVRAYDVEGQLEKWTITAERDVAAISVTDIDRDGVQELLLGDGQWGKIHAFDTVTLVEEWAIANPEHSVTNIAAADFDGDGTRELVWGAGATSTGPDHLYVANWRTRTILWQNEHLDGPFIGPRLGDLDGDGVAEIVAASSHSDAGYKAGRILVFDSATLKLRAMSPPVAGGLSSPTGIHDLELRDVNGDGRPEILIASDIGYDGLVEAYAFSAANEFMRVWTNATRPNGAVFYCVDVADVDRDGRLEVIAGAGRQNTGADGVRIFGYDAATGAELWHTESLGEDYWSKIIALAVADTDADGRREVIGMVAGGDVYIFDGTTRALETTIDVQGASLSAFRASDGVRLLVGDTTGRMSIHRYDGVGYPEVRGAQLALAPLDGLSLVGSGALWVGTGGTLQRFAGLIDAPRTFGTANYGDGFGRVVAAIPARQWVFSAGLHGVHGFRVRP